MQNAKQAKIMGSLGRSPLEQAKGNLQQALRVATMVKEVDTDLCPSPMIVLLAELRNVQMYLDLIGREG